ncbi:MAG: response regulator [Gammaproteobacteria bacterium]|nr:response regulator [Gammaproteobacteria bacterium]
MLNQLVLKSDTRYVILVGLSFLFILMLIVVFWLNNRQQNEQLGNLILDQEISGKKLFLSGQMAESARTRTRMTGQIIDIEDPFEQDDLNMALEHHAGEFAKYRLKYLELPLTPKEKQILEQHTKIVPIILPAQRRAVELAISGEDGSIEQANRILYETVYPGQGELIDTLLELSQMSQVSIERDVAEYSRLSEAARNKNLVLLIGILLSGAILATAVIHHTKKIHKKILASRDELELLVDRRTEDLVRKQDELKVAIAVAEEANLAKSDFLSSMSHEIRTPMNGVLGMLSLLLETNLNHVQHHRAKLAEVSAQSLLTLINDILDFSKIEAGKLELEQLDFDLRDMLGDFSEAVALQGQQKGLEIILDTTQADQATFVVGDPNRLRQILTNLVGNAIKFTEEGEIVIRAELSTVNIDQLSLRCSVSDTGIGIPTDKLELMFDSFSQADASTTRKFGGTGLGLAIAKNLTKLMGGEIGVTSTVGEGSLFTFSVILQQSREVSEMLLPQDIEKLHLLVVDDNQSNREYLCRQLEQWGVSVEAAYSGADALQRCEQRLTQTEKRLFDLILVDAHMPEMDGEALARRLQTDNRFDAMKRVMMTSLSDQSDSHHFSKLGFDGYFPKPATTADLLRALAVVSNDASSQSVKADEMLEDGFAWPKQTRLLLVEDNLVNQMVANGILSKFGLQADVAENGIEAIASLKGEAGDSAYTLILMDCLMPEMDGFETSERIRAGEAGEGMKNIPIIAMTANAMLGDRERCLEAGMSDYLTKPIDPLILQDKLEQWLK